MKTAIYIEDGLVQLVITPETEFEKNALTTFQDQPMEAKLHAGSFYNCQGGWVRQSAYMTQHDSRYSSKADDSSLILVSKTVDPQAQEVD